MWHQCDVDGDGYLDDAEFSMAIHQLYSWMNGSALHTTIPQELVPTSKQNLALMREIPLRRVTRVFISYRWETPSAKQLALLVREVLLSQFQYSYVFLDIFDLSGNVNEVLADRIAECHAVVPIWTKGCYDRCLSDPSDAVRREVEVALSLQKVIVPVIEKDFWDSNYVSKLPDVSRASKVQVLPEGMRGVLSQIGANYIHEYPEVMHRKLHRLLQGW